MHKILFSLLAIALLNSVAAAADAPVMVKNVMVKKRVYQTYRIRGGCPDGVSCYALYGAYGPWGGRAYWSSYSPRPWLARREVVLSVRY